MIAYYVHDEQKKADVIVIPDMGCSIPVTSDIMKRFIGVHTDFSKWTGNTCDFLSPDDFGTVVASRQSGGDVCVVDKALWENRMNHHLSGGR